MRITAIFWRTHFSGKAAIFWGAQKSLPAIFWERRSPLFSGERRRPHFQGGATRSEEPPPRGFPAPQRPVITRPSSTPTKLTTKLLIFI